jgi:hypothetical protein
VLNDRTGTAMNQERLDFAFIVFFFHFFFFSAFERRQSEVCFFDFDRGFFLFFPGRLPHVIFEGKKKYTKEDGFRPPFAKNATQGRGAQFIKAKDPVNVEHNLYLLSAFICSVCLLCDLSLCRPALVLA